MEERKKGLEMTERYTFGSAAMVQEISLLGGSNITTARLFERTTEEKLEEERIKEE